MYSDEISKQYTAKKSNFNETVASQGKPDGAKQDGVSALDAAVFSIPIALIVCCTVLFFMMFKKWTVTRDEIAFKVRPSPQIPCINCRFFSGNHYLKCAVSPSIALTEKAIHCSDYSPQDGKFCP